jgi:hypothetical protein
LEGTLNTGRGTATGGDEIVGAGIALTVGVGVPRANGFVGDAAEGKERDGTAGVEGAKGLVAVERGEMKDEAAEANGLVPNGVVGTALENKFDVVEAIVGVNGEEVEAAKEGAAVVPAAGVGKKENEVEAGVAGAAVPNGEAVEVAAGKRDDVVAGAIEVVVAGVLVKLKEGVLAAPKGLAVDVEKGDAKGLAGVAAGAGVPKGVGAVAPKGVAAVVPKGVAAVAPKGVGVGAAEEAKLKADGVVVVAVVVPKGDVVLVTDPKGDEATGA